MAEPQRLRIATFNIRHAAPKDSYRGPPVVKPFREPRNAIIATVTVGERTISVGTGHFAADPAARPAQLSRAVQALAARPAPRILVGDFNIPWRQAATWLEPYGLELA